MNEKIYIDGSEEEPTVLYSLEPTVNETVRVINESWLTETTLIEYTAAGRRITGPDGLVMEE